MFEMRGDELRRAMADDRERMRIVALETAVLTHGLPYPINIQCMRNMCEAVREAGAIPAPIGIVEGRLIVGLDDSEIERLGAEESGALKLSSRDLAFAMSTKACGGTTVAGTLAVIRLAGGIRVFATGGIGGVHRGWRESLDVSADLNELAKTRCCVVCSGAKSILDVCATLEALETRGIPVVGYRTCLFPQFYFEGDSEVRVPHRVEEVAVVARLCETHWDGLESQTSVVLANSVPAEDGVPQSEIDNAIDSALRNADEAGVKGAALTPFLLEAVAAETEGRALRANLALLESNARLAGKVAVCLRGER